MLETHTLLIILVLPLRRTTREKLRAVRDTSSLYCYLYLSWPIFIRGTPVCTLTVWWI